MVEAYHVKNEKALKYTNEELLEAISGYKIARRNVRPDMQNFVLSVGGERVF